MWCEVLHTSPSPDSPLRLPADAELFLYCTAVLQAYSPYRCQSPNESWQALMIHGHLQGIGFCPSCTTTLVKALTKGPVRVEDIGSLPSQSMLVWSEGRSCCLCQ